MVKKYGEVFAVFAVMLVLLLAGCGRKSAEEQMESQKELIVSGQNTTTGNTEDADQAADVSEEGAENDPARKDDAADQSIAGADDTGVSGESALDPDNTGLVKQSSALPIYSYHGSEPYMDIVTGNIVSYAVNMLGDSQVYIPAPTIVRIDDSDSMNIKIWGYFDVYGYNLNGTTLETQSSAAVPGCMHLTEKNGSYVMTSWQQVLSEDERESELRAVCDDDEELTDAFHAVQDTDRENSRKEYLKEYISENSLGIDGYKDFDSEKVMIPE